MYIPPARGIMAASSPKEGAPAMVSTPVKNHATSSQPALPIWRDMSADTMKIPEPIITPTTTITESNRPRPRANVGVCGVAAGEAAGALVIINVLVILAMLVERFVLRRASCCSWPRQVSSWRQETCAEMDGPRMKTLDAWIIYTRLYLRVELIFRQFGRSY